MLIPFYRIDSAAVLDEGYRIDRAHGPGLQPAVKTEGGWLIEGYAARPGIYTYKNPDGSLRRELVNADTFAKSTSMVGLPVTVHHPASRRVDSSNRAKVVVGEVREAKIDQTSGRQWVRFFINDAGYAEMQAKRLRGLSPGYNAKLDLKGGTDLTHGPFDLSQASRAYNHLALCGGIGDPARGGQSTSLRVDSETEIDPAAARPQRYTMRHLLALALALSITTRNDAEGNEDALSVEIKDGIDALKSDRDKYKGEATALRADAKTPEQVNADFLTKYNERSEVVEVAERYNIDAVETLGTEDLRKAVVLKAYGDDADAEGSADYFRGMFDTAKNKQHIDSKTDRQAGRGINPPNKTERQDADDKAPEAISTMSLKRYGPQTAA